ncbi:MAG: AAA family ATPase [Planctomycetota bacterium]|jgi:MoxR-like ATPase
MPEERRVAERDATEGGAARGAGAEERATTFRETHARLRDEVAKLIVGHADAIEDLFAALLAGGHVLEEGVPGIGKTRLVQTVAKALSLSFRRIQFTPDLMPGDITGTELMSGDGSGGGPGGGFRFERGPVFAQVVLADEVNRATPKTQSALLEAMQERAVTSAGVRHELPSPFFVLATQNPIEMAGTYPLPEAQLDRFMLKLKLGLPDEKELVEILARTAEAAEPNVGAVASAEEVMAMQALAREVPVASSVRAYAARLVLATHPDREGAPGGVKRYVRHGASPRAAQALVLCGKVHALLAGRMHVGPSDVRRSAAAALRHRLVLNIEAHASGADADAIVAEVTEAVPEGGE